MLKKHFKKQNFKDFHKLKRKLQVHQFFRPIKRKTKKKIKERIEKIPRNFLAFFDQESYLKANPDVKAAIETKKFSNALEHFIFFGYEEVKEGKRHIGKTFPLMSESMYLLSQLDVKSAYEASRIDSVFEHFLAYGYRDFMMGKRNFDGIYPLVLDDALTQKLKESFDEASYLRTHPDVKRGIEEKRSMSAWDHFINNGMHEIRTGKRAIHRDLPPFTEAQYIHNNKDVYEDLLNNNVESAFIHLWFKGQHEILEGRRKYCDTSLYRYVEPVLSVAIRRSIKAFHYKPMISVIMDISSVGVKDLMLAINSLKNQWYKNWEVCIVGDASTSSGVAAYLQEIEHPKVKINVLDEKLGFAGICNAAFELTEGDYTALMEGKDELTPDALYEIVRLINEEDPSFIYTDEDRLETEGRYTDPHFKPDFSEDMSLSQNYFGHLSVVKSALIQSVGKWDEGLDGAWEYDLILKVLEQTERVGHIDKVLYHAREGVGTDAKRTADALAEEKNVLERTIARRRLDASVEEGKVPGTYRVKYALKERPLVSIIIPFNDKPELLEQCLDSIISRSTYTNFEVIAVSNNSEERETFEMMEQWGSKDSRINFYEYNTPFNYSKINNYAIKKHAKGEHLILLNNDIEIITPNWIESMLEFSQREEIGAVGAKLYYPDDTIQHAGVIMGLSGLANHSHRYIHKDDEGYFAIPHVIRNMCAVTGACMMVKRSIYEKLDGLNEKELPVAFNDVDFCLRIRELGYNNVFTPYSEAYHYESVSRGEDDTPEKLERANREIAYMQQKYKKILEEGDPYYNRNLTLKNEQFSYRDIAS